MARRRRASALLAALAIVATGLAAAPALASAPESSFVSQINAERAASGLAPVEVYWDLVDDARAHSMTMEAEDRLHHNPALGSVTTGWQALGENVGVGPSVGSLHDAFMASSGHRANILGDFNYVGVGVTQESDTKMWVTVVFMRGPAGLVTPPEEPPPAEEPPVEEPPVEEAPVEESPVEEPPVEESPVEEPPAESPVEEPPAPAPRPTPQPIAAPREAPAEPPAVRSPAHRSDRLAPFAA